MTKVEQPVRHAGPPGSAFLARLSLVFLVGWLGIYGVPQVQAQERAPEQEEERSPEQEQEQEQSPEQDQEQEQERQRRQEQERRRQEQERALDQVLAQEVDTLRRGLPVRLPALDLAELLGERTGSFLYRFGEAGWPDGWSQQGLGPRHAAMTFNGIPFSHVFTGRPGFDIAPIAFIDPPRIRAGDLDRAVTVRTRLRPYIASAPLTELKYWKGAGGLESIDGVHVQNRRRSLFGEPGFLNLMGSYSGRGADGIYPGSRLRRGRQVQLRLRYAQVGWSVELLNVHTRRTIGAHGGVIPETARFESIYSTVGAVVENPRATRRIMRNDLLATGQFALMSNPLTATGYWTAETFRYRDEIDTVGTTSDRLGIRVEQPLTSRPGGARSIEIEGWTEHVSPALRFDAAGFRRSELHASARDSVSLLGWGVQARLSAHAYDGSVHPGGRIDIARDAGAVALSAGGGVAGQPASPVEMMGFKALGAASTSRAGRLIDAFAGVAWRGGPFDVRLRVFASRSADPRDIYMTTDYRADPDSATVLIAGSPMVRAGTTLDAGWRRDAERGLYAFLQPTISELLNDGDSALHERTARALPTYFGRGRIGVRALLFRGDLDLDVFVEAYAWSANAGRALHPETGLLAVPLVNSIEFAPSSIINLGAEAGVREATLFFIYQNAHAGTELMVGNLIVPIYPLPAQQFRFGVYWPIFD